MITPDYNELYSGIKKLLKNKYFYFSLLILAIGFCANFFSQIYLHQIVAKGEYLPILSDLILDNIPYYDVSFLYDIFSIFSMIFFFVYIAYKKDYESIPFYIFLFGLLFALRSVFIILTPIGNPLEFTGTKGIFNGFSKYELGVYPSGHTGATFLYFLFAKGAFRWIIGFFCLSVIISLFLARGHYSIDILSGILFSYAVYSFGNRYFSFLKTN